MTDRPLVTIGMPVYNAGTQLREAIAAIRNQTWANLDILISDNASTDETAEICLRAADDDSRIRYVRQASNLGPTANFEYVRRHSRGQYFAWAAHDDLRHPEYVAETVAALEARPQAVLAHSWTLIERADGSSVVDSGPDPGICSEKAAERLTSLLRCPHNETTFYGLFRAWVLSRLGPIDDCPGGDHYFLFDTVLVGQIVVVPRVLFQYRMLHGPEHYRKIFSLQGDVVLDQYRRYRRHLRRLTLDPATERRCTVVLEAELEPALRLRLQHLLSEVLADRKAGRSRIGDLIQWAVQYPPALRSRMFWGALRRLLARWPR